MLQTLDMGGYGSSAPLGGYGATVPSQAQNLGGYGAYVPPSNSGDMGGYGAPHADQPNKKRMPKRHEKKASIKTWLVAHLSR